MSALHLTVLLVVLARLAELAWSARNTALLLKAGGREHGRRHYPLFVFLHGGWLLALVVLIPSNTSPQPILLALFAGLQLVRLWILTSLGRNWTTRIITLPGRQRSTRGLYRWLRHPNYVLVALELALLPLVFGAWHISIVVTALNVPLLLYRTAVEEVALKASERSTCS